MRSRVSEFEMVCPPDLPAALRLLDGEPGAWTPIAGGTDLMVQLAGGRLAARRLVSIWGLAGLQGIHASSDSLKIGAGCTYAELRRNPIVTSEFPSLAEAAAWTGGLANQNRGTLGGNIVNASPAADSPPALLVYDAVVELTSVHGTRRVPYAGFHKAYKKMDLAPNELLTAVLLPRRMRPGLHHIRKVGPRRAQAISKVGLAAYARLDDGVILDIRVALSSVAPTPIRCFGVEDRLLGRPLSEESVGDACTALVEAIQPIDDVRSTGDYRRQVAVNLLTEFLGKLAAYPESPLARWNGLSPDEARAEIRPCGGSSRWAEAVAARRPYATIEELVVRANAIWWGLDAGDWREAFATHPRIGASLYSAGRAGAWSSAEQAGVSESDEAVRQALADGNLEYEARFGHIYIVCATGKSAEEMLAILRCRLSNDPVAELREAAGQQAEIMALRLRKWLAA